MLTKDLETIPIFFAVDDDYIPFLAVTLESLIQNSSAENLYSIKILYTDVSDENKEIISKYEKENIDIEFVDLNYYISKVENKLYTRDYYTKTTYFRLFIPDLYPQYNKVLYLDGDIVVLGDIAELYNTDMKDNLIVAIPDGVIQNMKVFQEYAEKVVGVASYKNYFNAGVLVMNLDELRKFKFQEKFLYLLENVKFSVAQDQDYLNRLCKGRVTIADKFWNVMPIPGTEVDEGKIKLIHYNFGYKPWHFDVLYQDFFWNYAKQTAYYDKIKKIRESYTEEEKFQNIQVNKNLMELAQKESDCVGDDREYRKNNLIEDVQKSPERLKILSKIEELEKEGIFDVDVEDDPPSEVLMPDNVDYLRKKYSSRIKRNIAMRIGEREFDKALKQKRVIIKNVNGLENIRKVKCGAIITCNHFNPYDSFTIEKTLKNANLLKGKKLYKVIREGNYTNFPGLYGFLFKNADTLPLSSSTETMKLFLKSVEEVLNKGNYVLIYPEQSMWWNYRKPKPLKNGAYKIASKSHVPVIPIFITMEDSNIIGEDGFPIQEYTVNIEEPIFYNETISENENMKKMKEQNFEVWKNIYEDFYQIPLQYTTQNKGKIS